MKTVIVTSHSFPEGKATANRVRAFAEKIILNRDTDEVEIVTPVSLGESVAQRDNRIKVINLYKIEESPKNLVWRAMKELFISFKLWSVAQKSAADVVIVTIPSVLLLLPVIIFKKPKKLVLDVRDVVWSYFTAGILGLLLGNIMRRLFSLAANKADLISVTNFSEAKDVELVSGVTPIVVANGISNERLNSLRRIKKKCVYGKVNVTYVGNIGFAQELEILIKFASYYASVLEVHLVGKGIMLERLKKESIEENLQNFYFHGEVPFNRVKHYIEAADILFAQIGNNYKTAVPTKVFEYMASGRRVLLGLPKGVASDVFREFRGVEVFSVGSFQDMKISYEKLLLTQLTEADRGHNLKLLKVKYLREKNLDDFLIRIN